MADAVALRADPRELVLHELPADFADIPTEDLMEYLGVVGADAVAAQALADESKAIRLRLFAELDDRKVSYRRMAKQASGISSTAILKALQRRNAPANPVA